VFSEISKVFPKYKNDIYLPVDFAIEENGKRKEVNLRDLPSNNSLFDIGEKNL